MSTEFTTRDVTRVTLAVLCIGLLIGACFLILRPFLPALIWSAMIVIATWPLMLAVQKCLWDKRGLAVMVMTLALVLLFLVPVSLAVGSIVENADKIGGLVKSLADYSLPPAPAWLYKLPSIGPKLASGWQQIASKGQTELAANLSPHIGQVLGWFANKMGSVGAMLAHFLLTLVISAILFFKGEKAAAVVLRFAYRLAGPKGENATLLAAMAIRAVALGVIITALAQSLLAGLGLAIAGIHYAALLTGVIFILGVLQVGAGPVLLPTAVWLYWHGDPWWGTGMLIWTVLVSSFDNFLRPMLIRRGADLPLLLIITGVIGGLIAFGIIGLFIGPVMLALSYTLVFAWIDDQGLESAAPPIISNSGQDQTSMDDSMVRE